MVRKKTGKKAGKALTKTLVLLDAHAILHRAYHALPEFTSPKGDPTGALYGVVAMLLKIIEELQPDYIAACYDLPEPTYRHEVFKEYKAGRQKADESLITQINRSRDVFAAFGIPIFEHPGFEADDILGTITEQTKEEKQLKTIIASGDMDTLQLVDDDRVCVYTLKKGIKDTILYDEQTVQDRFQFGPELIPDYKGLRGDPSDNIPGIPGIGEKTATELIVQFGSVEALYTTLETNAAAFSEKGIKPRVIELLKEHKEEAEFSKMLATIRRDAPITYTLPDTTWREKLDVETVLSLFQELGFRTLASRVQMHFGGGSESRMPVQVPESEMREVAVQLWLLRSDITNPTYEDIMSYARSYDEHADFKKAREIITEQLKAEKLHTLWKTVEKPLMQVIDRMESTGIHVDVSYLKKLSQGMHAELEKLEQTIYTCAGTTFNINSPKQMAVVLYDTLGLAPKQQKKTATGQRSTRESELEKLTDEHEVIPHILRYRELQKLVSTYIDVLPALVRDDGRIHTTFLQAGTTTGRMASKDPNMQNIPIRTPEGRAIRRAFVADAGYTLVSIDYSQVELRVAAILSQDKKFIDIFKHAEDVHQAVAAQVFGVAPSDVTRDMRRRAKVINFGILYGMGVTALRQNLGGTTTRAEAQEFLNAYFNTFTRLAEYLEETKMYARAHGYTETYFGRRRYFPGMQSSAQFVRAQAERMAINAPVQGTAADMIRIAMVAIDAYLHKHALHTTARLLLQVHDELVFEVENTRTDDLIPVLVDIMENAFPEKERHGVPIIADVQVGSNWEDMRKVDH